MTTIRMFGRTAEPQPHRPSASTRIHRRITPPSNRRSIASRHPGRAAIERDRRTVSQNLSKDVPLVVARGRGMAIEDVDGNRFLDFAAGISTVSTGHCHPDVVAAVREQSEKLLHVCYTDFYYPVYIE